MRQPARSVSQPAIGEPWACLGKLSESLDWGLPLGGLASCSWCDTNPALAIGWDAGAIGKGMGDWGVADNGCMVSRWLFFFYPGVFRTIEFSRDSVSSIPDLSNGFFRKQESFPGWAFD